MRFKKSLKRFCNKGGYTLIEVLVGMFILSFGLVGSFYAMTSTNIYMTQVRQQSLATQILQERIEEIRGLSSWTAVTNIQNNSNFTSSASDELKGAVGTQSIAITGKLAKITLTVSWKGQDGRDFSQSMTTYLTQAGINNIL